MTRKPFLILSAFAALMIVTALVFAQQAKPQPNKEVFSPVPTVVTPGRTNAEPPSDAIVLFNGKNLDQWVEAKDDSPAKWDVHDGIVTVNKAAGSIQTKHTFRDYQLHIEWKVPTDITGSGQHRGNSGVFLATYGPQEKGIGYELQVLDSYNNKTYVNGQAGAIYLQSPPLVNANRKPGEWQTYDVAWTAPTFNSDGSLKTPAYVTVFFNGILVQNHFAVHGTTDTPIARYLKYDRSPIKLQAHGDPSQPISYRNIWARELP